MNKWPDQNTNCSLDVFENNLLDQEMPRYTGIYI